MLGSLRLGLLLPITALLTLGIIQIRSFQLTPEPIERHPDLPPPHFKDCTHLYLDVGSNIGVQVRKLFEPNRYPNAPIHSLFKKTFSKAKKLCALGFEANPLHTKRLKEIQNCYYRKKWNIHFFTERVVSTSNNKSQLFMFDTRWGAMGDKNRASSVIRNFYLWKTI